MCPKFCVPDPACSNQNTLKQRMVQDVMFRYRCKRHGCKSEPILREGRMSEEVRTSPMRRILELQGREERLGVGQVWRIYLSLPGALSCSKSSLCEQLQSPETQAKCTGDQGEMHFPIGIRPEKWQKSSQNGCEYHARERKKATVNGLCAHIRGMRAT